MYDIDINSKTPIYVQLYEQIKKDIQSNLKAGEKLPSIRKMTLEYKISKNTVQSAYNQLYAEGYIQSIPQSGYFVSKDLYETIQNNQNQEIINQKEENSIKYDFYPACLSNDLFPKKIWLRLYNKVLKSDLNMGIYHDIQGDILLREEIAKYLIQSRGVNCSANNIVITSGFSDSIHLITQLLKNFITKVAFETPSYRVAKKVFLQHDCKIEEIKVNKDGIDIKALNNSSSNLLYITPSHQYYFGVTTPIAKRVEIINWAKINNCYIIEDDYDSELSYNNRPVPAMQSINNNQQVIYTGTFSKSFSPSIRVAYLVLPKEILKLYKKEFDYFYSSVPIDTQKTLALFIKEGYWDRHLRKVRTINKRKHDIMKDFFYSKMIDEIDILRQGSGLNFLIKPKIDIDLNQLVKKASKKNIKLYLRSLDENTDVLSMGFGGFEEEDLKEALNSFYTLWKKQER